MMNPTYETTVHCKNHEEQNMFSYFAVSRDSAALSITLQ